MDHGGVPGDGVVLIEHGWKHVVGDVEQRDGLFGYFDGLGGNGGNAVTDVSHLVVKADLVVRLRVGPRLAARGVFDARRVLEVEYGVDSGKRRGCCVIDVDDAGMGMGAP